MSNAREIHEPHEPHERSLRHQSVFVTGGTGFLGYHLIAHLLRLDARVTVLARRPHDLGRLSEFAGRLRVAQHDLASAPPQAGLEDENLEAPAYVFHLAASGVEQPSADWSDSMAANVSGTASLLQWCGARPEKLKGFVYAGTPFEYGVGEGPRREDQSMAPTNFYAASKGAGWLLCQAAASMHGLPTIGVRPFSTYGPHQGTRRLVPAVILGALRNAPIELTGGDQQRDFVFVQDVIEGMVRVALHAAEVPEARGEMFNLGSGEGVTLRRVVARILELSGSSSRPSFGSLPYRAGEMWDLRADTSKTRDQLGWVARTALDEGLSQAIAWYRHNLARFAQDAR